jgi:hypothetical protein
MLITYVRYTNGMHKRMLYRTTINMNTLSLYTLANSTQFISIKKDHAGRMIYKYEY